MNNIQRCEHCGSIISEREIALYFGLVRALWRVYQFVSGNDEGYRFTRRDIKHLFKSESDTARFGDWVHFGGLVFKEGKARYGLNRTRCREFFEGTLSIPKRVWKNPITGETRKDTADYVFIDGIPNLKELLDAEGYYQWRYRDAQKDLF